MSWPLADEPPLDLADIQGHILVGFGGAPQALGAYTAADLRAAAATTARWAGRVTTAEALYRARKGRRARDVIAGSGPWVAIAVSHRLLLAADRPADLGDEWFAKPSMASVSSLNDPFPADPQAELGSDWVVGSHGRPVDVLVIVAAGRAETAEEVIALFTRDARDWIDGEPFVERLIPMKGAKEHFGFRDGVSQPALLGTFEGELFDGDRPPDDGTSLKTNRAQDLVWPGEFVFGYEGTGEGSARQPGEVASPEDAEAAAFARNGSLLVYRRLAQDVAAFHGFCAHQAAALAPKAPGLDAARVEQLVVGRRRDGLPLTAAPDEDVQDPVAMNGFTFNRDAMASACPRAAHIRKVNPRDGQSDVTVTPRILRRGAPFGDGYVEGEAAPPERGRGLAFLAYQTDTVKQFGTLTTRWANHTSAPAGDGGHDLLIGQVAPGSSRWMDLRLAPPPLKLDAGLATWVHMTGGAFLFAPSLPALRSLGEARV